MKKEEIIAKLKELIKPYVEDISELENIDENTSLQNALNIDSVDLIEIIVDIESSFDIEFENSAIERVRKIGDIIEAIQERV